MNILIVDGNEKKASDCYVELGMDTQYEVYSKILKKLSNNHLNIAVVAELVEQWLCKPQVVGSIPITSSN